MSKMIQRKCANCGGEFLVSCTNKHRILCGSEECKLSWHRQLVRSRTALEPRPCLVCGTMFFPKTKRSVWCNDECRRVLLLKKNNERYHANKDRYLASNKEYRLKNKEKLSLQSTERARRWRENNPKKYQAQNNEKRFGGLWTISMDKYGYTCKSCESRDQLVVHHIDMDPTNNVLSNLVVLCRSCHAKLHQQ